MVTLNFSELTPAHQNTIFILEEESRLNVENWKNRMRYPAVNTKLYSEITNMLMIEYQLIIDIICEEFGLAERLVNRHQMMVMPIKDALTPITYEKVIDKYFKEEYQI